MKYRAALIGCGKIGCEFAYEQRIKGIYSHAGAYEACPETDLMAVCDVDKAKAAQCGKRWNVGNIYTDPQCLLHEEHPDIVSICTPSATHAEILNIVLQEPSVQAVLVEKPITLDFKRAEELVQLAFRRGIVIAVNYSRRYSESYAQIRDFIRADGLGSIQTVSGFYTKGIINNGSHWFDLVRYMVGEVKCVRGFCVYGEPVNDPTLDAWLNFDNGASGYLHGCSADAFSVFEMDIVGTKGRIRVVDSGHKVELFKVDESPYYSGYLSLKKKEERNGCLDNTLLNAVKNLVGCLENSDKPRCSGEDGIEALRIAAAVQKAAQSGMQIVVSNMRYE